MLVIFIPKAPPRLVFPFIKLPKTKIICNSFLNFFAFNKLSDAFNTIFNAYLSLLIIFLYSTRRYLLNGLNRIPK